MANGRLHTSIDELVRGIVETTHLSLKNLHYETAGDMMLNPVQRLSKLIYQMPCRERKRGVLGHGDLWAQYVYGKG
jgi:hypothetical protein